MYEKYISLLKLFDEELREPIKNALNDATEEIRLRINRPVELVSANSFRQLGVYASAENIRSVIRKALRYSMFAGEDSLREGWISLEGGHRLSFCGRALRKDGKINGMDCFSSVNIRMAREALSASKYILPYIKNSHGQVLSSLIVSPPGVGKTTVLRDIARTLSTEERPLKVAVADERGEIASCRDGIPMLNIGNRCDVLEMYDKSTAVNMFVRLMSPDVIITDEIGSPEDIKAICDASACGVRVIASAHGNDVNDFFHRSHMKRILDASSFDRFIFITRTNNIITAKKVYDGRLNEVML
ncbi:MAG: hypothetical protein E7218_07205 [Anaerofustis stercorihominis]|nr:hypothetical protein [Anaerofustis stercorihominis]